MSRLSFKNPNPLLQVSKEGHLLYSNADGQELLTLLREDGQTFSDSCLQVIDQVLGDNQHAKVKYEYGERILTCMFVPVETAGYVSVYGLQGTGPRQSDEV